MTNQPISLTPLASDAGVYCMLALDHRDALRNAFRRVGVADAGPSMMRDVKERIAATLGENASGILLDHAAVASRPANTGLLVPLEAQGYESLGEARLTKLEFDAAGACRVGADGCKLLLWYRADHPASAARQREVLARATADCHQHGLPLIVEPLVYRLEHESEEAYAEAFPDLVVSAAAELHDCDLLKLQYPGSEPACARITAAASPVEWALLGGSEVDAETFASHLRVACRAGAAGFIAGRAIWVDCLGMAQTEQKRWLEKEALPRFNRLCEIAHQ